MGLDLKLVAIDKPADVNLILGQSHFIKTVEDLYEAMVGSVPGIKFGLAFCEASGACLIRTEGTDEAMKALAVGADRLRGGHRHRLHRLVRALRPDEARARGLAEGEAELDPRDGPDEGFVQVLDRLDEVRLAEDEVHVGRLVDRDQLQLEAHAVPPGVARVSLPGGVAGKGHAPALPRGAGVRS